MSDVFKKFVNDWVLCSYSVLTIRIDKARALAEDDEDERILDRMVDRLNAEGQRLEKAAVKKDYYRGELLHDRFRVIECSGARGKYFMHDGSIPPLGDLVRKQGHFSDAVLFDSVGAAEDHAHKLAGRPVIERSAVVATRPVDKVKPPKAEPKAKKPSVSGAIQSMLLAKVDEEEIWLKVKADFGLDDGKKGYVAWNRKFLIKAGKLT